LSVTHAKEHGKLFKDDKLERTCKEAAVALNEVLSLNLSKRSNKSQEKPQSG
jgi:hypothetical protein